MRGYRDLIVWQKAIDLVVPTYRIAERLPRIEIFALGAQFRRAVVSIPANLAEGHSRRGTSEFLHHMSIARGSLAEVETLVELVVRLGYASEVDLPDVRSRLEEIRRLLQALMLALERRLKLPSWNPGKSPAS
ncbi:MAG: four helix bundle protein [Planctomycetes bacterium]|nr:four helix bundle protein [Planctomycetota bacterium]